jgi:uncharacterized protein (DUF427 family)
MNRPAKIPGPDHPIAIAPTAGRVTVRFAGEVVAESDRALTLKEASYPPVQYVPRADARMAHFARSAHATWCPYKGDCSYFSLKSESGSVEHAVWSYEHPFPAVQQIAGHLAFYPDKVEIEIA